MAPLLWKSEIEAQRHPALRKHEKTTGAKARNSAGQKKSKGLTGEKLSL